MKYDVIYADPPWAYGNKRTGGSMKSGADQHYPTMTMPELMKLPVLDLAEAVPHDLRELERQFRSVGHACHADSKTLAGSRPRTAVGRGAAPDVRRASHWRVAHDRDERVRQAASLASHRRGDHTRDLPSAAPPRLRRGRSAAQRAPAMSGPFDGFGCDMCGKDAGCTCPPCQCVTCRQMRGDPLTSRQQAQLRATEAGRARQELKKWLGEISARRSDRGQP